MNIPKNNVIEFLETKEKGKQLQPATPKLESRRIKLLTRNKTTHQKIPVISVKLVLQMSRNILIYLYCVFNLYREGNLNRRRKLD
jgi:hypothetical protein